MLPMKRSEVFKILSDIFSQPDIKRTMDPNDIVMIESPTEPYDIDFWLESTGKTGKFVSYLRIVNPPANCVDGEYRFVYHVQSIQGIQKTGIIAIDSSGNIRVYGDNLVSFIYNRIKDNANRLADYAKKITRTYHKRVADIVIYCVKTYCETLINEHASTFDQMDMSVSEGCCTEFHISSINEPERNFKFFVVEDLYKHNIKDNEIRVRVSKPDGWIWTPFFIRPFIGDISVNTVQPVFTDIFGVKELLGLARLISERTGFAISVIEGDSTREKNIAKYIKSLLQKHEVLDTVKQDPTSIFDDVIDKKLSKDWKDCVQDGGKYTMKNEYYIRGDVYRIRFLDSETLQTIKKACMMED